MKKASDTHIACSLPFLYTLDNVYFIYDSRKNAFLARVRRGLGTRLAGKKQYAICI